MNRRSTSRLVALTAAAGLAAAALSGCATGSGDPEASDGEVTLTWWHNATSGPMPAVWEEVAAEFEADHPGVTVEQTGYQNEELQRTLIPNALAAGDPPDLFQVWPGGELSETFTFTINWGDGTAISAGAATVDAVGSIGVPTAGSFDGQHTYADNGVYTVSVTVFDDDGGQHLQTFQVTVLNVAPTLQAS